MLEKCGTKFNYCFFYYYEAIFTSFYTNLVLKIKKIFSTENKKIKKVQHVNHVMALIQMFIVHGGNSNIVLEIASSKRCAFFVNPELTV